MCLFYPQKVYVWEKQKQLWGTPFVSHLTKRNLESLEWIMYFCLWVTNTVFLLFEYLVNLPYKNAVLQHWWYGIPTPPPPPKYLHPWKGENQGHIYKQAAFHINLIQKCAVWLVCEKIQHRKVGMDPILLQQCFLLTNNCAVW